MKIHLWFVVCGLSLLFVACDSRRIYEENREIPETGWDVKNKINFEVDIKDTLMLHNFYINVRNSDGYPFSNLFLFIKTTNPDGYAKMDTFEVVLADDNGKWTGSGIGDLWDNQRLWKTNVRFPKSGKYTFTYEQAMRNEILPLILDVGLRIEKVQ